MTTTVLLVDDSGLARRGTRRVLESAGYSVVEAEDGLSALERYALDRPDVVLLDLVMKGMYGLDVLAKLREIDPSLEGSNIDKDPDEWVTGDEPMTGAQASYLKTLSDQAGVEFEPKLSKADASKRIDELQERTGRGR